MFVLIRLIRLIRKKRTSIQNIFFQAQNPLKSRYPPRLTTYYYSIYFLLYFYSTNLYKINVSNVSKGLETAYLPLFERDTFFDTL